MKLDRLVIESIEGRILLGIVMFTSIMILVGWVAINEPARMAAFERQHTGRSIERGAELFASNCSTCHAADGLGIAGRAPGLNSPHLFGYDFLAEVNGEIGRLQRNRSDVQDEVAALNAEREDLFAEVANADAERRTEIQQRIQEIDAQINPDNEGSLGAQIADFDAQLEPLLAQREEQLAALEPAMRLNYYPELERVRQLAESEENPFLLTSYLAADASRLSQVEWGGDLRSYLTTTLIHGRPGSSDMWDGNAMVAWSQLAGGPLREDQIEDLVSYIMNWDKGDDWSQDDLFAVNQFARIQANAANVGGPDVETVGTDVEAALADVSALTGDATRGEALYEGQQETETGDILGCTGCHLGGAQAPPTDNTWARTQNERLTLPEFEGYTVEQYLIESIVRSDDYIAPGYSSGVMLGTYGAQMTDQDMADILAYLETQQ